MKAVVLLSGGLDSAVCLAKAIKTYGAYEVQPLSLYYGQKHDKEMRCAEDLCAYYDLKLMATDLSDCFKLSSCALLKGNEDLEHKSYAEQLADQGGSGTVAAYVPFRNGLFLAYATAIAYSIGAEEVWYGAHSDDAAGSAYPDCTEAFRDAMGAAMFTGTGNKVQLIAPILEYTKAEVVNLGISYEVPFNLTWSCYEGGDKQCGTCATCLDRIHAFKASFLIDPQPYANDVNWSGCIEYTL